MGQSSAVSVAALCVFSTVACGGDEKPDEPTSSAGSSGSAGSDQGGSFGEGGEAGDSAQGGSLAGGGRGGSAAGRGGSSGGKGGSGGTGGAVYHDDVRVFVSSVGYVGGAIGGISGGDALCQSLADTAGLNRTFQAWLSNNADFVVDRFIHSNRPYRLRDGTEIAANWTDLTDGMLAAPINQDELGSSVEDGTPVWTATAPDGTNTSPGCSDWMQTDSGAFSGLASAVDGTWTEYNGMTCENTARIYCFEKITRP